jgi:hypothetical protein
MNPLPLEAHFVNRENAPAPTTEPLAPVESGTGNGWFKATRGHAALELIRANPLAYVLAAVIAHRGRWREGFNADGLALGEAFLGDFRSYGMSERQYRTAKQQLAKWRFATFKATNKGTVAKLMDTRLFSILPLEADGQNDGQPTDKRRTSDGQATDSRRLTKNVRPQDLENKGGEAVPPVLQKLLTTTERIALERKLAWTVKRLEETETGGPYSEPEKQERRRLRAQKLEVERQLGYSA